MTQPGSVRAAIALALCVPVLCVPALAADQAITAEEFDALTRGKTFAYTAGGLPYGVERYLPGRRVYWAFVEGPCEEGFWYEQDGQLCFEYDGIESPQCWYVTREAGGIVARFAPDGDAAQPVALQERAEPLVCPGPRVGA